MGTLTPAAFAQLMGEMAREAVADPSWAQPSEEFVRRINLEYDAMFKEGAQVMPSKSPRQHRFMEAVKHNPKFAKKAGVPQSVGRDFVAADKKAGKFRKKGKRK